MTSFFYIIKMNILINIDYYKFKKLNFYNFQKFETLNMIKPRFKKVNRSWIEIELAIIGNRPTLAQ